MSKTCVLQLQILILDIGTLQTMKFKSTINKSSKKAALIKITHQTSIKSHSFHHTRPESPTNIHTHQIFMWSITIIKNRNNFTKLCQYFIMSRHISGQYTSYDALTYFPVTEMINYIWKLWFDSKYIELYKNY